jgi:hypothetical protein
MSVFWKAYFGAAFGRLTTGLFIAVCVLLGFGPEKWAAFMIQDLPGWVTPTVARSAFLLLAVAVFFAVFKPWRWFATRPFIWTFDINSPLAFGRSGDGPVRIDAFQVKGKNCSNDPVAIDSAIIRSNIDNHELSLQFGGGALVPVNQLVITPQREFVLIAIPPSDEPRYSGGLSVPAFKKRFASFSLLINLSGGRKLERRFDNAEVERILKRGTQTIEAMRPQRPDLMPRQNPQDNS